MDHVLPAHHEYEVIEDWHRPSGDESEWRVLRCTGAECQHIQREGRELTGLDEPLPLGPS